MHDLIKQIEHSAAGSVTEEIRLIKQRRKNLDHIIKFTLGISRLQQSLESVLLLKKPTKDIPRDLLKVLGNISENVANLPSTEITKRLNRIEDTIKNDMDYILGVSNQPESIDGSSPNNIGGDTNKLQILINDFRRRINTAIVLKLHLRTRGVQVAETTVPITAEELVSQASKLVVEEKKCRNRTKDELQAMDNEMEIIIENDDCPESMKVYANELRQQINKNIEHINKGRDIEKMPYVVEIIQMGEDENKNSNSENSSTQDVSDTMQTADEPMISNKSKSGFFSKVEKWISTPWSVKWKDIE